MFMKNIFKYASLFFTTAMLAISCGGPIDDTVDPDNGNGNGNNNSNGETVTGTLTIEVDKQIIQSNGADAASISVYHDGTKVTSDVIFHNAAAKDAVIEIPDFKFTTETAGEYRIWAEYKGLFTKGEVKITAVASEVPTSPVDPQPSNTSFVRNILLIQFTGSECGNCPLMKAGIKQAFEKNPEFKDYVVKVDAHNYSPQDPAYLAGFYSPADGWPTTIVDWKYSFGAYKTVNQTVAQVESAIKTAYSDADAKAGISVNAKYADGVITIKAVVKAAVTDTYRIGAFLTEDGIQGQQADLYGMHEDWMDIFDDSIRIADCKVSARNYMGHSLGQIEAGKTGEYMFIMNLKNSWNVDKLELVLFASTKDNNGNECVNNVVKAPINGEVQFNYAK